jgi:hypothetical protein
MVLFVPSAMVLCCVQVPLMAALPCAQAAMDAHRGVAAVAEHGLGFLRSLSFAEANQVSWACCRLFGSAVVLVRMHAQCALRSCVADCRCR